MTTAGTRAALGIAVFLFVIAVYGFIAYMPPSTQFACGIGVGVCLVLVSRWAEG